MAICLLFPSPLLYIICLLFDILFLPHPLRNTQSPIHPHRSNNIKHTKRPHKPEITPPVPEMHAHTFQECIGGSRPAETAAAAVVGDKIPALLDDVRRHVFRTCDVAWRFIRVTLG
ncbi:uncharacterized protein BDW43DRAFT_295135 [Aspergillus alliaceus]|uniref:uncharacterized protein n=1 Tax=Petromyces alliaceus TaxID=209559 RepID=UPI0012A53E82|nr:uncharacterized protein BDW43DRAFT_295135 [Aspergillus alliaceus]KAB8227010.1 hypothetical protein BDW43DRAFT_295135 [Aspergillus alliaceus]